MCVCTARRGRLRTATRCGSSRSSGPSAAAAAAAPRTPPSATPPPRPRSRTPAPLLRLPSPPTPPPPPPSPFPTPDLAGGAGAGTPGSHTPPGRRVPPAGPAVSLQTEASDSASGQTLTFSATGLPAGLSISSSGLITGTPTTAAPSTATVTASDTTGASGSASFSWVVSTSGGSCPAQSNTPNFGPNVHIFDPSMSSATIQSTLDSVFNAQKLNQFGTRRDALLFKPGTYSNTANMGYYTSIQGLGQNPDDVTINGDVTVDAFDGTGNATQNFWRSAENLSITPSSGSDRWAVAQAGPLPPADVHRGPNLVPAPLALASRGLHPRPQVARPSFPGAAAPAEPAAPPH